MSWTELEAQASAAMDAGANGYVFGSAGTEDTERENRAAFTRHRIVPRMLRDVSARDLAHRDLRCPARGAGAAGAGRRAVDRASRRGAGRRARCREAGVGFVASTRSVVLDGGDRCRRRRRAPLVPAVLAQGPRADRKLRLARRGGRLRRAGRHAGHRAAGVASARPADRLSAVPAVGGHRKLPVGSGFSRRAAGAARGESDGCGSAFRRACSAIRR